MDSAECVAKLCGPDERVVSNSCVACPAGTTLRSYLSEKLHCDPMRITKKFAGDASIGKRVFTPCKQTPELQEEARRVRAELRDMERRFAAHRGHGLGARDEQQVVADDGARVVRRRRRRVAAHLAARPLHR